MGASFLLAEFVENGKDGQPFWIEDGKIALRKKICLVKQGQINSSDHSVALCWSSSDAAISSTRLFEFLSSTKPRVL